MAHRFSTNSLIWVLGLQSLNVKWIMLAARGPNRRGPLTAGGIHDRRGPWSPGALVLSTTCTTDTCSYATASTKKFLSNCIFSTNPLYSSSSVYRFLMGDTNTWALNSIVRISMLLFDKCLCLSLSLYKFLSSS